MIRTYYSAMRGLHVRLNWKDPLTFSAATEFLHTDKIVRDLGATQCWSR